MTKPNIQIGDEVREMTQDEFDRWQQDANRIMARLENRADAAAAKAAALVSARAKLKALGLTDAEIVALVG